MIWAPLGVDVGRSADDVSPSRSLQLLATNDPF